MGTKSRRDKERLPALPAVLIVAVIDDDRSVREQVKALLTGLGHQALEFPNAESFLQEWEAEKIEPHLIFLDYLMPGLTGIELSRRLNDTMLPIVIVTAVDDPALLEQMALVSSWVLNYIPKPVDVKDVVGRIAFIRGQIRRQRADEETKLALQHRIDDNIDISRARGVLECRYGYNENAAHAFLNDKAKSLQITLGDSARRILEMATSNELNGLDSRIVTHEDDGTAAAPHQ